MRLGVNVVRLTRPFTGVGRYVDGLLREWSRMRLPFDEVVLYAPLPVDPTRLSFPLAGYRLVVGGGALPDPLWEWRTLAPRAAGLELLFCPSYTVPFGYRGAAAVSYFGPAANAPGSFEWWRSQAYDRLHRYSVRRAARVFTAATSVKRRVVEAYAVPEAKVEVIPLAPGPEFAPIDAAAGAPIRQRYLSGPLPYVLFVGKLSGRHRLPRLLEAFARVRRAHALPHRLLLVGPNVLRLDVAAHARRLGLAESIQHVGSVPAAELPALYSGADALAFPATEAEGFGLPILEAMACGTAVVSCALGSVPEVAGDAALLAETASGEALAAALGRVLCDAGLREGLRRRGLERARLFSWRRTAERTLDSLWRLASSAAGPAAGQPGLE